MISIPLIRRELTSDVLGRHVYLFGAGSATTEVLRRLAQAGAQEGTVVLSEDQGGRISAATFRPTRSLDSACRMARTRQLCAICSDLVDSCSLSTASADRTSAADSLRSGRAPIRSVSGLTPSR